MTDAKNSAREAAREVGDHGIVEKGARLGFAMSGLIHLLIGWIALKIAWGFGGGSGAADKSGALATAAGGTTGPFLLWLAVLGFALLALWELTEAVVGRHGSEVVDRAKAAGKAVMYAFFAWSALGFIRGAGGSDEQKTDSFTATLMSNPGGRILVGLVGAGVLAAAGYHVWKGWTKGFLDELEGHPGAWAVQSGRVGYIAKGVALAVAGLLFVGAALSSRASEAGGLDAALKELRDQPFGPYLLTVVAFGIAAYGLYSFAKARHAKL
ncbi:hypothetical protein N802_03340 [Knoellia sinensis KCTC 19936]|uniref:DUF1206 domain-containing protein n=1 Tax=Knoellia sinensis KCTC 19936 TaxID=1385520 RepID=A0A0A0J3F5_9MICO|nr:DUF1206 domain-containing protein [Knoellia sinensis]KGN31703.1 hypothetical protein N802_03340 [Knoellia sinensis KCTC 19936]